MKKIVFVQQRPFIRAYKMAKALKYTGRYMLVCICDYNFFDEEFFKGIFDKVYFFRKDDKIKKIFPKIKGYNRIIRILKIGFKRMVKILKILKPDIINCFSEPYDYIKYILKNVDYPVVLIDGNDFGGISSGIENINKKTRTQEKFCFENVAGICHKGPPFEIDYYRQHGYEINCPEVRFMNYCDEYLFADLHTEKLSDQDGEIHLVYTGYISINPKIKYCYYIPIGKQLAQQKIHLHIYPNPQQYNFSKDYVELDRNEKYFHFHKPIPVKELSKEIAKYDWGVLIHVNVRGPRWTEEKTRVGMSNKLFSYMEAGLPIVVSEHLTAIKDIVQKYGIGFVINDNEINMLREIIKECDYEKFKENVKKSRERLSLKNQEKKLDVFYKQIIKKREVS